MLAKDGSEFTVFYLQDTGYGPSQVLKIVDDAGVDIATGKYVGGGDDKGWVGKSIEQSMKEMETAFFSEQFDSPTALVGPIGPKGHTGWKGEQEAYAGEMVLPEDMVMSRLYKVEGIDTVARFMGEYNDLLFKMKHHNTWFYIPMDAKVRKIGKSEVDEYLG